MYTALTVLSSPDSWLPLYWHLDKGTLIPTFNAALSQEDVGWGGNVYIHAFLTLESSRGMQEVLYAVERAPSNHHVGRWVVCSSTTLQTMEMRKASATAKI
jgi:hypothetical protein